jgi:tape measure domain-containing protein
VATRELTYDIVLRTEKAVAEIKSMLAKSNKEAEKQGKTAGENYAKGVKSEIDKLKIDILQGAKVDKFKLNQLKNEIQAGLASGQLNNAEALGLFNSLFGVAKDQGAEVAKQFSKAFKITINDRINKILGNLTQPFKTLTKNLSVDIKNGFNYGINEIGKTSLKDLTENTKNTTAKIIENIKKIPSQIGDSLVWVKKNILDFDLNKLIYKDFPAFTKQVFNNFKGFASGAFESLKQLPSVLYNLNLNKVFSGLGGFSSAIQGGIKNLGNFGSILGEITSQGINGFGKMASSIAGGLGNALASAGKGALNLAGNLAGGVTTAGVAGVVAGGAGLFGLGAFGVNLASQIQSTRISLETMLGSAENAKGLMTEITAFAKKTPFNRLELFDYSKQLIGVGIAQKDMIGTLNKLGNVAAGSGAPLQNIITNYGQIRASNRAYTQDLKQFSNFGIPIWEKLAKNMGITVEQLRTGIDTQKIKVNFQEVDKVLNQLTSSGGQYFDLMQKKSGTFEGAMSNLQDTFESMVLKFMGVDDTGNIKEGSFFDIAQDKALKFQGWLMENEAQIGEWGGKVFTKIGQGMQMAWTDMVQPVLLDLQDWFNNGGKEAIKSFMQNGWQEIVKGFTYFKDVVYPDAKKKLDEFKAYMASEQGKKDIKDFTDFMKGLWEAIKFVAYWSGEAIKGIDGLIGKWRELSNATKLGDSSFSFAGVAANPWVAISQLIGGKRASGGPVDPGKLYEVGENNRAELLMMNGRQYMIPGNKGQVLNQSQIDNRQINSGNNVTQYIFGNNSLQYDF